MVRYSFPVGLFHSLQHAGLSRRTHYFFFEVALDDQESLWKGAGQYIHYRNNLFPMIVLTGKPAAIGD
jgi:hypothetical protein